VLRVAELCELRWDQFDFEQGLVHVRRLKNGRPSVHPIRGMEIRALRRLKREQVPASPYVFTTERRGPMSTAGLRKLLARVGEAAEPARPSEP
jgi:type 1 fimbriae regulatory protein FimE